MQDLAYQTIQEPNNMSALKPVLGLQDKISQMKAVSGSCSMNGVSGCTCFYTNANTCSLNNGVFQLGGTCNSPIGSCCLKDKENNTVLPCQNISYCECYNLATSFNFSFNWTTSPCSKTSCGHVDDEIGACCDGNGLCTETTEKECLGQNFFFQGVSTVCGDDICIGGTGGCCDGITCNDGITGTYCISQKRLYLGKNQPCYNFVTSTERLPCLDSIVGYKLKIGDIFEDGIVVGIYNPRGSTCWGNPIFGNNSTFSNLTSNDIVNSSEYTSLYDYNGYGVNPATLCDDAQDSYIMIMALHPASEGVTGEQKYTWSHGGFYYGPLIKSTGQVVEPHTDRLKNLKEGYIINSAFSSDVNEKIIEENAVSNCSRRQYSDTPIERIYNRTTHNFNGRWFSDWGLHNTIRMVNAQLYYEEGITTDSNLYPSMYSPSNEFLSQYMIPSTSPIRVLNENSARVLETTSSWFIPSINELSFIAHQCKFNALNDNLTSVGGTPLFGEYWSSTGTFHYAGITGGEGYSNGITTDNIGTYAWSVNFDNDYSVRKDERLDQKKVRPIRLIRCDGNTLKGTKYSSIWEVNY